MKKSYHSKVVPIEAGSEHLTGLSIFFRRREYGSLSH